MILIIAVIIHHRVKGLLILSSLKCVGEELGLDRKETAMNLQKVKAWKNDSEHKPQ